MGDDREINLSEPENEVWEELVSMGPVMLLAPEEDNQARVELMQTASETCNAGGNGASRDLYVSLIGRYWRASWVYSARCR